jgi:hypothetical protein
MKDSIDTIVDTSLVLNALCPKYPLESIESTNIRETLRNLLMTEVGEKICDLKTQFDSLKPSPRLSKLSIKAATPLRSCPTDSTLSNNIEIAAAIFLKKDNLFYLYESTSSHRIFDYLNCHKDFLEQVNSYVNIIHETEIIYLVGPPSCYLLVIAPRFGGILKSYLSLTNFSINAKKTSSTNSNNGDDKNDLNNDNNDKNNNNISTNNDTNYNYNRVLRSKLLADVNSCLKGTSLKTTNFSDPTVSQVKLRKILQDLIQELMLLSIKNPSKNNFEIRHNVSHVMPLISRASSTSSTDANKSNDNYFEIPNETKTFLAPLVGPFRVIVIVGKLRGGKSFIITQILRHMIGHYRSNPNILKEHKELGEFIHRIAFETSDAFISFTQGAMICAVPNPDDGGTILLIDSEGTFARERDKNYDAQLFSIIFSIAEVLLFNHADGVLNNTETLESLELSVPVAKRNAPPDASLGKTLLMLCRNSRLAGQDFDDKFRRDFLEDTFKSKTSRGTLTDKSFIEREVNLSSAIFGDCFSLVDVVHIATPRPTQYLSQNLVDQNFNDFDPLFRGPFDRCYRIIASKLQKSSPQLALCGSIVENGAQLVSVLDGMITAINSGKEIPSLDSAALLVQRNSQNAAENVIVTRLLQLSSEIELPVIESDLEDRYNQFFESAKLEYEKNVLIIVNRSDFDTALKDMSRRFHVRVNDWKITNKQLSAALAELVLVESFADFLRTKSGNKSQPIPKYVFDEKRDATINVDAFLECKKSINSHLNQALQIKVNHRVSKSIIDEKMLRFTSETIEPHCTLVASQWKEAKSRHETQKQYSSNLAALEEKQRINNNQMQTLRNELTQSNNQLKADIEKRNQLQKRLEQEAAELKKKQDALLLEQKRAAEEEQRLRLAEKVAAELKEKEVSSN